MNSIIQCLGHTPYMKEFLCGTDLEEEKKEEPLYKKQINPYNAMGCNGELINSFAILIKELWTNKYSVIPKNFKSSIGKYHEQFKGS
mmetsp:Transcript_23238/g.22809  ORF Transcript_23238/g.22809 Transcript_23238/m.22809 type:complete len:87 (+) Transcript_23238:799-1059(+)